MDKINKILLAIILFYILLCNTSCSYNNINYDRLPDSYKVETDNPYMLCSKSNHSVFVHPCQPVPQYDQPARLHAL